MLSTYCIKTSKCLRERSDILNLCIVLVCVCVCVAYTTYIFVGFFRFFLHALRSKQKKEKRW